ncbi:MAG: glycosyltransferase family 39 protein, partial [Chloroflexi bacterium]|nr:glycosyltransferase family 39 protein [Chloroflexota bacterium]
RLLSVAFGVGNVYMTYLLARALFSRGTGLVAGLMAALSTYQIYYSRYLRGYIVLSFLALVSFYFLYRALTAHRFRYWLIYVIATALALYVHSYALFLWGAQGVYGLAFVILKERRAFVPWVLSQAAILIVFSPWFYVLMHQTLRELDGADIWIKEVSPKTLETLRYWLFFKTRFDYNPSWARLMNWGGYFLTALPLLALLGRQKIPEKALLFLFMVFPVVAVYIISWKLTPIWDPRFLVFISSPFYILVARGIMTISLVVENHRVPLKPVALATMVLISGPPLYSLYREPLFRNQDLKGAASYIRSEYRVGDNILHLNYQSYLPFLWYNRQGAEDSLPVSDVPCVYDYVPKRWCQGVSYAELPFGLVDANPWLLKDVRQLWIVGLYTATFPGDSWKVKTGVEQFAGKWGYKEVALKQFWGVDVYLMAKEKGAD